MDNRKNWFSKHVDTVIVLSGIVGSLIWMNNKFNKIQERFAVVEKDLAIIKAVLIIKNIMPTELSNNNLTEKKEG